MRHLIALACLAGLAQAQGLAEQLPEKTMLCAEWDDLGGAEWFSNQTALGRILAEPEVAACVKQFGAMLDGALRQVPFGVVGLDRNDLRGIRVSHAAFAVVDANYTDQLHLDLVLSLRFRAGAEKANKILDAARGALEMFARVQFRAAEVAGHKVWRLDDGPVSVLLYQGKDHILVTTREERLVQLLKGPPEKSLAQGARYRTILQRMGAGKRALLVYADVPRIHERVTDVARRFGEDTDRFHFYWRALGFDALQAVAFSDIHDGAGFRTEMAMTFTERRGLFGLAQEGTPSHRFAKRAPANCLLYAGERVDLLKFWDGVLKLSDVFDARAQLERGEAMTSARLGIDVRRDLLASLGDEWGVYVAPPPGGGPIPDATLMVTVRDPARLETALTAIMAHLGAQVHETKFRGRTIRIAEFANAPVTPAWTVGQDALWMGLWPQAVKHALMEKASLAASPEFLALKERLPPSATSATWVDTKALATWIYNTASPVAQMLQGQWNGNLKQYGVRLDFHDLPGVDVITRHLGGMVLYSAVEPDCIRFGFVSDFGAPAVIVPAAVLGGLGLALYRVEEEERHEAVRRLALTEARTALRRQREANERLHRRLARIEQQIADLKKMMEK